MKKLTPSHIFTLKPYQSARRIGLHGRVYLNANESPWENIIQYRHSNLNRYPEFQSRELLKKYADYTGLSSKHILITRGADEGIELLVRSFCNPNVDKIMFFSPTYDMYSITANIFNVQTIDIPILSNFQLDINGIMKNIHGVKLIYLCNPNNPTGNFFLRHDIIYLLELIPKTTLLIIDEAYIDFSIKESFVSKLYKYNNLVIVRTLSKAFGLAALRCGFVLSNINIINILQKVLAPYPIATPVSNMAIHSLNKKNIQFIQKNILKILKNKKFLFKKLKHFSCIEKIFDSQTNFILIKFFQSKQVFHHMVLNGIIIRDQSHKPGLQNCLRISIGTMNECIDLVTVLSIFEGKKNI